MVVGRSSTSLGMAQPASAAAPGCQGNACATGVGCGVSPSATGRQGTEHGPRGRKPGTRRREWDHEGPQPLSQPPPPPLSPAPESLTTRLAAPRGTGECEGTRPYLEDGGRGQRLEGPQHVAREFNEHAGEGIREPFCQVVHEALEDAGNHVRQHIRCLGRKPEGLEEHGKRNGVGDVVVRAWCGRVVAVCRTFFDEKKKLEYPVISHICTAPPDGTSGVTDGGWRVTDSGGRRSATKPRQRFFSEKKTCQLKNDLAVWLGVAGKTAVATHCGAQRRAMYCSSGTHGSPFQNRPSLPFGASGA